MTTTREPIDLLEAILKKNWVGEGVEDIDLRNDEVYHYFYFDNIRDEVDLESAWSVFPEHKEIRARLEQVELASTIVPGWGYRLPKSENRCDTANMANMIRRHIELVGAMVLDRPGYRHDRAGDFLRFLATPFEVVLAPPTVPLPEDDKADLRGVLYEALTQAHYSLEPYPFGEDHYALLDNWAIYLTKCDEVRMYLLWPYLGKKSSLPDETPEPGFRIWSYCCRDRYWIKDSDYNSGVVYFRPLWLDGG